MLLAAGLLVGGGLLGVGYLAGRDGDGYFDVTLDRVESERVAVTSEAVDFTADPGTPDWVLNALDTDVRIRATAADASQEIFVGVASEADVDAYQAGVAHDEVVELIDGVTPQYRSRTGTETTAPPTEQVFRQASAAGSGTQELTWEATNGRWVAVLMNADGSPGVAADLNIGARAGFVAPTIALLLGFGAALAAGAAGSSDCCWSHRPTSPARERPHGNGRGVGTPTVTGGLGWSTTFAFVPDLTLTVAVIGGLAVITGTIRLALIIQRFRRATAPPPETRRHPPSSAGPGEQPTVKPRPDLERSRP